MNNSTPDTGNPQTTKELTDLLPLPPIAVEAAPQYLLGSPMVVAVTFKNASGQSNWRQLPSFSLFTGPGPLGIELLASDGRRIELPASPPRHFEERPRGGFDLDAGTDRRVLFDITELNPLILPGRYQLYVTYEDGFYRSQAQPVTIELLEPSETDRAEIERLRRENDTGQPSWAHFVLNNWRTVDDTNLSKEAREALALHLFLHHAIYGPTKVADLDLNDLSAFAKGPLEGEAAILRFEILMASGNRLAAVEEVNILKNWPGLKWRLEEIKRGEGLLTGLRHSRGAEQEFEKPPDFYPYTTK